MAQVFFRTSLFALVCDTYLLVDLLIIFQILGSISSSESSRGKLSRETTKTFSLPPTIRTRSDAAIAAIVEREDTPNEKSSRGERLRSENDQYSSSRLAKATRQSDSRDELERLVRSQLELGASDWTELNATVNQSGLEDPTMIVATYVSNLTASRNPINLRKTDELDGKHRNHNYEFSDGHIESPIIKNQTPDPMLTSQDVSGDYTTLQHSDEDGPKMQLIRLTTPPMQESDRISFFDRPRYMYRFRGPISDQSQNQRPVASSSRYHAVAAPIRRAFKRLDERRGLPDIDTTYAQDIKKTAASELNAEGFIDILDSPTSLGTTELDSTETNVTQVEYSSDETTTTLDDTTYSTTTLRPRPNKLPSSYKLSRTRLENKSTSSSTTVKPSRPIQPEIGAAKMSKSSPIKSTMKAINPSPGVGRKQKVEVKSATRQLTTLRPPTTLAMVKPKSSVPKPQIVTIQTRPVEVPNNQKKVFLDPPITYSITTGTHPTPGPLSTMSIYSSTQPTTSPALTASTPAHLTTNIEELVKHARHHHIHSHVHRIKPAIINLPYELTVKQPRLNSYESIMAAAAAAAAAAATASANRQSLFPLPARSSVSSASISVPRWTNNRVVSKTLPIGAKLVGKSPGKQTHSLGLVHSKIESKIKQLSSSNGTFKQTFGSFISAAKKHKNLASRKHLNKKSAIHSPTIDASDFLPFEPNITGGELEDALISGEVDVRPLTHWTGQQQVLGSSPLAAYLASMISSVRPPLDVQSHAYNQQLANNDSSQPVLDQGVLAANHDLMFNALDDPTNLPLDGANQQANQYEWSQLHNLHELDQSLGTLSSLDESSKDGDQSVLFDHLRHVNKSSSGNFKNDTNSKDFMPAASSGYSSRRPGQDNPMQYAVAHYIDEPAQYLASLTGSGFGSEKADPQQQQQEKHVGSKSLLEIYDDSEAKFSAPHVHHADLMTTHEYDGFKPIIPKKYLNNTYFFDYPPEQSHPYKSIVLSTGELSSFARPIKRPEKGKIKVPTGLPSQVHLKVKVPNEKQLKAYGHHVPPGHTIEQVIYPSDLIHQALLQAAGSLKPQLEGASSIIEEQKQQLLESGNMLLNPHADLAASSSTKHSKAAGHHSHKHIIYGIVPLVLIIIPVMIMIAVLTQLAIMIPIIVTVINIFVIPIIVGGIRPIRAREDINYDIKKLLYWPFPVPEKRAGRNETASSLSRNKRSAATDARRADLDHLFESLGRKFEHWFT